MTFRNLGPIALIALMAASPALAQSTTTATTGPGSIANLTCADIATLPAAYQAALIYYAAGYHDGMMASGTGTTDLLSGASSSSASSSSAMSGTDSSSTSASDTGSSDSSSSAAGNESTSTNAGSAMLGGLGLQAQEIVDACASAGTAKIVDVIDQNGGSAGHLGGASSSSSESSDMSSSSATESSSSAASDSSSSSAQ